MNVRMNQVDLFAGIGGFSLAGLWSGFTPIMMCEIDDFCQAVLKKNFPGIPIHDDIRSLDEDKIRSYIKNQTVTLVSGGFPCQPFSNAGKHRGKADDRYLWPEMFRIVGILLPTWVVAENVPGILYNESGLAFEKVCTDLESVGYTVLPLLIPAAGTGSAHVRERLFLVAYTKGIGDDFWVKREKEVGKESRAGISGQGIGQGNGRGGWWDIEPSLDRVAYGVSGRVDRLRSLGNAVVPQVAYQVFQIIAYLTKSAKKK